MQINIPLQYILLFSFLTACAPGSSAVEIVAISEESSSAASTMPIEQTTLIVAPDLAEATVTPGPSPTPSQIPTATQDVRLDPHNWRAWPIVPVISARALEIYQAGLAQGRDGTHFSVIGDCQSQPPVFLGIYDTDDRYFLGEEHAYLQESIDHFKGNFSRESAAVENGLSVASVFSPLWAPPGICKSDENPLGCELRVNNPSIVIISLGTNWKPGALDSFDGYLRQIVEEVIEMGALPVIATKADNVEEDNLLNEIMARVAYDYDIPLWNFWRAVGHLPNHGIDPQKKGGLIYLIPEAWDVKSFTALQTLHAVRAAASSAP
jgi:hypothetical protein